MRRITTKSIAFWNNWINKRIRKTNPQILGSQNIYILPSSYGWVFGLLLLSLFSGAINYQISTIFLMTFLLGVVALVSAWEAHANLKNLSIKLVAIEDSYQNTPAQLTLFIKANRKHHFGLEFTLANQESIHLQDIPEQGLQFILPIMTSRRGHFQVPRISISSLYPFSIFRVWSYIFFDAEYYVYPQPVNPGFMPSPIISQENRNTSIPGDNELYDLRQVESPWHQLNLIAWKLAAKNQGWYVKQMDSTEGVQWVFSLSSFSNGSLESKLQYLSYWLNEAESNHQHYGLQLNNNFTSMANGAEHLQNCLRRLASY